MLFYSISFLLLLFNNFLLIIDKFLLTFISNDAIVWDNNYSCFPVRSVSVSCQSHIRKQIQGGKRNL